ncbi:MAG: phosphoribosylglycinamide formyltransferase [Thermoplasmatota archaeon]
MTSAPPPPEGNTLLDESSKGSPEFTAMSGVMGREVPTRPRIAVLASGRGTDFQAIVDANGRGEVDLDIALLVCNVPDAFVIQRAKDHAIPYVVIEHKGKIREDFDKEIDEVLVENGIGLVVLAGFMRVLSSWFVSRWRDKIINIHPALLPSFPGAHAHRDALEYGVKVTGLTIHFVDEDVDHGPIIFQYPVEVLDDDDEETLSQRVLEQEHIWYPRVIEWIAEGKVSRKGRKVTIGGNVSAPRS